MNVRNIFIDHIASLNRALPISYMVYEEYIAIHSLTHVLFCVICVNINGLHIQKG